MPTFKSAGLSERGETVISAIGKGQVTPAQGAALMQTIAAQARIVEVDEIEKRVAALEQQSNRPVSTT